MEILLTGYLLTKLRLMNWSARVSFVQPAKFNQSPQICEASNLDDSRIYYDVFKIYESKQSRPDIRSTNSIQFIICLI